MKKKLLTHVTLASLILLITAGCSTNREYIRKVVQEEVKIEMKDINDFLNVAYGYSTIKHRGGGNNIDLKEINKAYGAHFDIKDLERKIKAELSKMDKKLEFKLVQVDNEIEVRIDKKVKGELGKVHEDIEDNKMRIRSFRMDISSNKMDINSNKQDIRNNRNDLKENRWNILENKKTLLAQKADLSENIDTNHRKIVVNKNAIAELKRSSAKLLLNINNAK